MFNAAILSRTGSIPALSGTGSGKVILGKKKRHAAWYAVEIVTTNQEAFGGGGGQMRGKRISRDSISTN
jgi:hypothetical protein